MEEEVVEEAALLPAEHSIATSSLLPEEEVYPIFRVPLPLLSISPTMFTPQVVALGPLHNPDWNPLHNPHPPLLSAYRDMEGFKLLACRKMAPDVDFDELVRRVKKDEQKMILECYGELLSREYGHTYVADNLARTLAIDACFIAAVLHALLQDNIDPMMERMDSNDKCIVSGLERNAHFFSVYTKKLPKPVQKAILQDALLVENQIPLLALKHVIRMESRCESHEQVEKVLEVYVAALAHAVLPFSRSRKTVLSSVKGSSTRAKHLLGMIYAIAVHDQDISEPKDPEHYRSPHVKNMHDAGHLRKYGIGIQGHSRSVNELSFQKGKLSIPRIHVSDGSETYLRNLLAYESCYRTDRLDILSYLHFMDFLIDTPKDVELLVECRVITVATGSKEKVAQMWNSLCSNTMCVFSNKHFNIAADLDKFCKAPWRRLWVEFYRSKLNKPWLLVSLISAIALLVMTFLILWYTILLYEHDLEK
eukprot:c19815_g1_i1 orf=355-1788(-)